MIKQTLTAAVLILAKICLPETAFAQINSLAVVHVETECRHQKTGAKKFPVGSGVVFDQSGYILTAAHVVQCEIDDSKYDRRSVKVRRGYHRGTQLEVDVRTVASDEDIAILKIVGAPTEYDFLTACRMAPLNVETPFMGYGFPEGQEFAPVPGFIGGETDEGNYSVVASFIGGMSGGPVVINGYVVALIEGGAGEVVARRSIIPLFRAGSAIEDAVGQRFPFCSDIGKFSVRVHLVVEEETTQSREKTSPRQGVSTGSLLETKCQNYSVPATQGWSINPGTVQITDRISSGSSRASIINIEDSQVIVEYCARSVMDGFNKKTGDSFGIVKFTELRKEKLQHSETLDLSSEVGKLEVQLPENTLEWTGELIGPEEKEPITFSSAGKHGMYNVNSLDSNKLLIQQYMPGAIALD